MKNLKTLTLAAAKPASHDPIPVRRAKLIDALEKQKALAADPNFVAVSHAWIVNENGVKVRTEQQKRVRRWWRSDAAGSVTLSIRYGAKRLEIEKGKPIILIPAKDKLIPTIDVIIAAVHAGELDELLAQQAKARPIPRSGKSI